MIDISANAESLNRTQVEKAVMDIISRAQSSLSAVGGGSFQSRLKSFMRNNVRIVRSFLYCFVALLLT